MFRPYLKESLSYIKDYVNNFVCLACKLHLLKYHYIEYESLPQDDYIDNDYEECPNQCVSHTFCNLKGVSVPPKPCGWDKDFGEDLLCCKHTTSVENKPQLAQFGKFGCRAFHEHCKKILELDKKACDGDFRSSQFMSVACMETCKKCGTYGCVDEFEECKIWSRKGYCSKYADFMVFNCRESCGTCGFRSDVVNLPQIVDGRDFSRPTSQSFFCGTSSDDIQTGAWKSNHNLTN